MKTISFLLASFGMWLTRRLGSIRPGEAPSGRFETIVEFEGFPNDTVKETYSSEKAATLAANVLSEQLAHFTAARYKICVVPVEPKEAK